jgi:tetratricopeptide (TPR) repeat protein/CHAT domain-containing protein
MFLVATVLASFIVQQSGAPSPELMFGREEESQVDEHDPVVETPTLTKSYADAPVRGKAFRLTLDDDGPVTIELRSFFFDAYLVVRDERGAIVAEDDDGGVGTHSRVVLEPGAPPRHLRVEACALHGDVGPCRILCSRGRPAERTAAELAALELENAKEAVRVVEASRGPDHPDTMVRLHQLGHLLWSRGDYASALTLFERALTISERSFGPDDARTITIVGNVAIQLKELGRYVTAEPPLRRQLDFLIRTKGPDDPTTIWVMRNLAWVLSEQGKFEEAKALHERALESATRRGDEFQIAQSLNNLASLCMKRGDCVGAGSLYERALAILESQLGRDHEVTLTCANNLAYTLDELGEHRRARSLVEHALATREKILGPDSPEIAASAMTLASLLERGGNAEEAVPLLQRAMKILEHARGADHPDTGRCAHELAKAYANLGKFDAAVALYGRALEIFEKSLSPEHPDTANVLGSLGWILANSGHEDEALAMFGRELKIREKVAGSDHPSVASVLSRIGLTWLSEGRPEEAEPLFERAVEIDRGAPALSDDELRLHLGNLALCQGDLGQAREAGRTAIEAWEQVRRTASARLIVATDWERFAWIRDNRWILEALVSLSRLPDSGELGVDEYDAVRFWKGIGSRAGVETHDRLVAALSPEGRTSLDELRGVQSALSRETLRYDAKDRESRDASLAALRRREGELQRRLAQFVGDTDRDLSSRIDDVRRALPDEAALVDFFVHRTYGFARRLDGKTIERGGWNSERVSAWILRAGAASPESVDLGPATTLDDLIRRYLEQLVRNSGAEAGDAPDGARFALKVANDRLRAALWDPLASHLAGVTRLVLSPDRFLGLLPFETLVSADGRFLLEQFAISYLTDADELARIGARAPAQNRAGGRLLVVGNVSFDREESPPERAREDGSDLDESVSQELTRAFQGRWRPLPGTKHEMEAVLGAWKRSDPTESSAVTMLEGAAATESALKEAFTGRRYVHLATHGFFEPSGLHSWWEAAEQPDGGPRRMPEELRRVTGLMPGLLSGLVCAGANARDTETRDDGYLTAEEVTWLDLSHCDLVALSACETGLGTQRGGEGMASVQHAFALAGARTVVSSLWNVEDDSAARLMQSFYENLWVRNEGAGDALRHAQRVALEQSRSEHGGDGRPYTWGAFVLSGDWR